MRLIILHGAPGCGKLTIGKLIAAQLPGRLMHNHLTVDLALSIYPAFGAGDFFDFLHRIRLLCMEQAMDIGVQNLIITWVYDQHTDHATAVKWTKAIEARGGSVVPVHLQVAVPELRRRIVDPSRIGTHKIHRVELFDDYLPKISCTAIPHANTITIDSTQLTVEETAQQLLDQLAMRS